MKLLFRIPPSPSENPWRRIMETAKPFPQDIVILAEGEWVRAGVFYPIAPFSLVFVTETGT